MSNYLLVDGPAVETALRRGPAAAHDREMIGREVELTVVRRGEERQVKITPRELVT